MVTNVRFGTIENFIPFSWDNPAYAWYDKYEKERLESSYPSIYHPQTTKDIFIEELGKFDPETFYVFIAHKELIDRWEAVIEEYDLGKFLIWSSRQLAQNKNYPEDGPRLKAYVFRGFNKE
jgi:hypothetical protein